jgi:hypothetical protein
VIRRAHLALAALALAAALALPAGAAAAPAGAAWKLTMTPMPANFAPGADTEYLLVATNVGGEATAGPVTLEADLPAGIDPTEVLGKNEDPLSDEEPDCEIEDHHVTCETSALPGQLIRPGRTLNVTISVHISAAAGELEAHAAVSGGGAGLGASISTLTPISSEPVPFDFLEFSAPASYAEGAPAVQAGSHPYQLTVDVGFPTERLGDELTGTGHPRDIRIDLPRGLLGDPAATEELCTEAELTTESHPGCPEGSQVGVVSLTTLLGGAGTAGVAASSLYNMVPPPGAVAAFGFNGAGVGLFIHLIAHVRAGEDYGAYTTSNDILALGSHPIFDAQAQIWGDPAGEAHDRIRGETCLADGERFGGAPCTQESTETPFLTMPLDCQGSPLFFEALADSWEEPAPEYQEREAFYESADLAGASASMEGCGTLEYEPKIEAQPTTDVTDSPAGLSFDLNQPQQGPEAEPLAAPATSAVKDTTVAFPPGLSVNPSQAQGLGACEEGQIGFEGEGKAGEPLFSETPQSCPEAAKVATVRASSPSLPEYDEATHEPERDPETGRAIPRELSGSVYLAKPFENPFGSLIAAYFAIEDEKTGIVAKLAGEGRLDPNTGQLTVRVPYSPELPIEDVHVSVFGGDRGAFITPPTCLAHQTATDLVPWSAPEAPIAHPADVFTPTSAPGGGPCPTGEAQMPNSPAFTAGTVSPQAGKYSSLLFKLSRQDGSQRFAKVEAALPPGLTAKLAGVAQCPEANIAKARSREAPNQGAAEIAEPSCPTQRRLGTVDVAAGAGPNPYHATGEVYLAGPYRDAPLSTVIIAPAVAGPFDLGTVVTRVALYLDPETARARAVSDPIPQLIEGVPLDVRRVSMRLDRPDFTLNPTSCDEEGFSGSETSALGQAAPLAQRFQVGGCASLPYKPKLTARLFGPTHRGAHPRLRAVFTARPGEANTAQVSFALPHSEFIDQAHFRTICTRVQFAAKACPPGSVYGHMQAFSPLVDYPLEGPVYLRSSSHELPDVVAALHGPPSQPIEVDLVGQVDSVHGGVRTIFASVPDAPVTRAVITMQGKKKGLFQNSTDICKDVHRITLKLESQSGKAYDTRPKLQAACHKKKRHKKSHGHKGKRR